jgi:hypothetical protein
LCLREVRNALTELKSRYARGGNDVAEGLTAARFPAPVRSRSHRRRVHEFIDFIPRYLIAITIGCRRHFWSSA